MQSQISFLGNNFSKSNFFEGKFVNQPIKIYPLPRLILRQFVVQTSKIWLSPQVIWAPTLFWKVDAEGAACPLIVTVIKVALIVKRAYIWQDVLFPVGQEYM